MLLALALASCTALADPPATTRPARPGRPSTAPATAPAAERTDDELDVFEAVFRYQFNHNESGAQQKAPAYFLSIKGKDPDAAFLRRFRGNRPPVAAGSEFEVGDGLKFDVSSLKWLGDDAAEVGGGYYEGNLSSSASSYRLVRKDKKWVVEKATLRMIS